MSSIANSAGQMSEDLQRQNSSSSGAAAVQGAGDNNAQQQQTSSAPQQEVRTDVQTTPQQDQRQVQQPVQKRNVFASPNADAATSQQQTNANAKAATTSPNSGNVLVTPEWAAKNKADSEGNIQQTDVEKVNALRQQLGLKPVGGMSADDKIRFAQQKAAADARFKEQADKKTWRDYLFGSKTDEEWNKKRREKIAAVYDLVLNLGNLYTTSRNAVPQKFESAYDRIHKEHKEDAATQAKKDKDAADMAYKQKEADRNYNLSLNSLNLKRAAEKRAQDMQPYEMAKAIAEANAAKIKGDTEGRLQADKIRKAAAEAAVAEAAAANADAYQKSRIGKNNRTGMGRSSSGGGGYKGATVEYMFPDGTTKIIPVQTAKYYDDLYYGGSSNEIKTKTKEKDPLTGQDKEKNQAKTTKKSTATSSRGKAQAKSMPHNKKKSTGVTWSKGKKK